MHNMARAIIAISAGQEELSLFATIEQLVADFQQDIDRTRKDNEQT